VALLRAAEMARPEADRICTDPYARSFVNPLSLLVSGPFIRAGLPDRLFLGGAMTFALAREQFVHDAMVREATAGLDQVVILGAGFDTRAYRITQMGAIPVFEVDHPVTQAAKRKAIRGVVEPIPSNVTFVPVDFDVDDLGDRLAAAGYDPAGRTLFVWQGVTMYLTAEGVDRTLAFIAQHSAPGSVAIFDYFSRSGLADNSTLGIRFVTRAMGEATVFGIDQADIVSFLGTRGFCDVRNVGAAELKARYLTGANAGRPVAIDGAIATARVAARS
jgi:methyltransferase (TIGR00027 family)